MPNIARVVQDVNGDPFLSGGNINITNNSTTTLTFIEVDNLIGAVQTGESVSLDGGITVRPYTFLGFGDVRGDPQQFAAFIRIDLGGSFLTVALDMNADNDFTPDLQNGNTMLTTSALSGGPPMAFPACFAGQTLIKTKKGNRRADELIAGDHVLTLDRGMQPLRWVGRKDWLGMDAHAPIQFLSGAIGNKRPLWVSPQHRMLVTGWRAQLISGEDSLLVAAKHLVNGRDILRSPINVITYVHLLFDQHEIISAEGSWCESFHPGDTIALNDRALLAELNTLFPEIGTGDLMHRPTARLVASRVQADALQSLI